MGKSVLGFLLVNMKVQGKIVIITGAAQGLGKAFARRLLQAGAKVCISDIREEVAKDTLAEFEQVAGKENVHFLKCDVTKEDDLKALYDGCEEHFGGKVDIFCNNAGINHKAGWKKCMDIDIMAVMTGTYLAMERMSKKNGGAGGLIVNTASLAGIVFGAGVEDEGKELADANSYFVAKHGVVALTRSLANKSVFAETGVQLRCICPSFADTNIIREGIDNADEAREKIKREFGLMKPEFVADGFYSLITECSNGDALVVARSDTNFIIYPDYSMPLALCLAVGAKFCGSKVFKPWQQFVYFFLIFLCLHFLFGLLLSFVW